LGSSSGSRIKSLGKQSLFEGGGDALLNPETLRDLEEIIHSVILNVLGSRRARSAIAKLRYTTGLRASELLLENPNEFREMLYSDYGALTDEIILRLVEALNDVSQSRERPPPLDSPEFKDYLKRLVARFEERVNSMMRGLNMGREPAGRVPSHGRSK